MSSGTECLLSDGTFKLLSEEHILPPAQEDLIHEASTQAESTNYKGKYTEQHLSNPRDHTKQIKASALKQDTTTSAPPHVMKTFLAMINPSPATTEQAATTEEAIANLIQHAYNTHHQTDTQTIAQLAADTPPALLKWINTYAQVDRQHMLSPWFLTSGLFQETDPHSTPSNPKIRSVLRTLMPFSLTHTTYHGTRKKRNLHQNGPSNHGTEAESSQ